jgi:predicted nucleotidyltransferase
MGSRAGNADAGAFVGRHTIIMGMQVGTPIRQERIVDAIAARVTGIGALDGAILVGSLASGAGDAVSDVDVVISVRPDRFDEAWEQRRNLHAGGTLAGWDERSEPEVGVHRWVTDDCVLVEALFATPSSGARLAPPWRVLVGRADLADRFPHRAPIDRSEMDASVSHPIDRAFEDLKRALRDHMNGR